MKTIHKFLLKITEVQDLELPVGAQILTTVKGDYMLNGPDHLTVWAKVDTEEKRTEKVRIHIFGTGHPLPDEPSRHAYHENLCYIDTVIASDNLAWHVFGELDAIGEAWPDQADLEKS